MSGNLKRHRGWEDWASMLVGGSGDVSSWPILLQKDLESRPDTNPRWSRLLGIDAGPELDTMSKPLCSLV